MKTVGYVRVSTERQTEGNGPDQQRRAILAYCAATGLTIDEWVEDEESGTVEERAGIVALLARQDVGTLVFDRIDRLGRTVLVSESLFKKFAGLGVRMECVEQRLEGPVGVLTRQIMGAVAEFQRTALLGHMKKCRVSAKASKGAFGGGTVPYGFRSVGHGKLAVAASDADLVRRCCVLRASGLTLREVCDQLTLEGFRTRKGTEFAPTQVMRISGRREQYSRKKNFGSVPLDAGVQPAHEALFLETPNEERKNAALDSRD